MHETQEAITEDEQEEEPVVNNDEYSSAEEDQYDDEFPSSPDKAGAYSVDLEGHPAGADPPSSDGDKPADETADYESDDGEEQYSSEEDLTGPGNGSALDFF